MLAGEGLHLGHSCPPTGSAIQSGTGHDEKCFEVLDFLEAVLPPNGLTFKAKARTVSGRDALLGYFPGCAAQPRSQ